MECCLSVEDVDVNGLIDVENDDDNKIQNLFEKKQT